VAGEIYAVVLAAGRSTRFDGKKLLQEFGGRPLLQHSLAAAQAAFAGRVVLVAGHEWETIIESSGGLADRVVINTRYAEGQGGSIAAGVRACRDDADAIVIMLADQPLVTAALLEQLAASWTGKTRHIVASDYGDSQGPPVLFGRGAFDQLCALDGDHGARQVIQSGGFDVATIAVGSLGFDIDTPEDLAAAGQFLAAQK
jgi:molybdenum cofactor cytidylyltransferase